MNGKNDPRNSKVLLIVDDEESIRESGAEILKTMGCTVIQARNGREALDIVKSTQVDLLLSDVNMSPGDGVELLQNIRNAGYQIPVIMMSGYCTDPQADIILSIANCFLRKPFSISILRRAVEDLVPSL